MEPKTRALLDWCVQLTRAPASLGEADLQALRDQGFSDEQLSAAGFLCAYFNFINRVAEGLGVDQEEWMRDLPPLGPCSW
jgi:alkylhydroperoxidase family enzyme